MWCAPTTWCLALRRYRCERIAHGMPKASSRVSTRCTAAATSSAATLDEDPLFDRLCPHLGLVGVSVEYRLAPEAPYPAPLEDCYRGLVWTYEHAEELGIDRDRIGVGGISAGGGLAAALALLAKRRGEVPVAFQLLDCPMLDDRQPTASSRLDGLPVWSRESNTYGWRSYLGDLYGREDVPCTAAPARATDADLVGLPPAFVSVGAIDGFLDEDVEYALRLNRAGVPAELHVYPGACHGYQLARPARSRARAGATSRSGSRARFVADGNHLAGLMRARRSGSRGSRALRCRAAFAA